MAGYSGTPLAKKLGIKESTRIFPFDPPPRYPALLGTLPAGARIVPRLAPDTDIVHIFSTAKSHLAKSLRSSLQVLKAEGAIWVSWPKRASGVASDITENTIRELALPLGLVDIKVCAVDDTWSGLKLVIRKENRKKP